MTIVMGMLNIKALCFSEVHMGHKRDRLIVRCLIYHRIFNHLFIELNNDVSVY